MLFNFCQCNQITDLGKTTIYHSFKKSISSNRLFYPLKGITCMAYFMTNKKTPFIFWCIWHHSWLWCSCLKDCNLLININQLFLQSHVMLLPSAYPQYLMKHETDSEHNLVVYFPLANKEKEKSIRVYMYYIVEEMGMGGNKRSSILKCLGVFSITRQK